MRYALLAVVVVAAGWLYWDARIPGLPLTPWQVEAYLRDGGDTRRVRRALEQLRGPHAALEGLRAHKDPAIRAEVARLDPRLAQLEDPSPLVRTRAALAFAEAGREAEAARPALLAALRPWVLYAAEPGLQTIEAPRHTVIVKRYLAAGESAVRGQRLAEIDWEPGRRAEVLRALGAIGVAADLPDIELFAQEKYPEEVRRAAAAAAAAIRGRRTKP